MHRSWRPYQKQAPPGKNPGNETLPRLRGAPAYFRLGRPPTGGRSPGAGAARRQQQRAPHPGHVQRHLQNGTPRGSTDSTHRWATKLVPHFGQYRGPPSVPAQDLMGAGVSFGFVDTAASGVFAIDSKTRVLQRCHCLSRSHPAHAWVALSRPPLSSENVWRG